MVTRITELMQQDMVRFMALSLLSISVLLYFLFGNWAGVVLPLLVVVSSLVALFGLFPLTGQKITPPAQILPTFQLTVGVAYPVHFLSMFFKAMREGATRADAVVHSLGHSGLPIVMTALTTMGGMASFATASLQPLAMLGYLVPAGVVLAVVFSLVLLPGLAMVIPLRAATVDRMEAGHTRIDRLLLACGRFSLRHRVPLIAGTLLASALSVWVAATGLRFSHDPIDWLPEGDPLRIATERVNDRMGATTTMDVVVNTGHENGLYDPAVLDGIERLRVFGETYPDPLVGVRRVTSLADVIKEIHQALNENRPEFYAIPRERRLVAQELLLFENTGADDLERITDTAFSKTRVTLHLPWGDTHRWAAMVDEMEARLPELLGNGSSGSITGLVGMMCRTLRAVTLSMAWSYLTSLLVVTGLMVVLIGNLRGGLVSMLPNLAPILFMHALMVALDLPLEMFTLMAGSTALGLAVDDTIHFIHVYRREFEHCGDPEEAVRRTMTSTGRANLIACVALTTGFFVFLVSSMQNLAAFGLLTGFAFLSALAVELLVTPALLVTAAVGGEARAGERHRDPDRRRLQAPRRADPVPRGVGGGEPRREDRPGRPERLRQDHDVPPDHARGGARRGADRDRSRRRDRLFQPGHRRDEGPERARGRARRRGRRLGGGARAARARARARRPRARRRAGGAGRALRRGAVALRVARRLRARGARAHRARRASASRPSRSKATSARSRAAGRCAWGSRGS